MSEVIIDVREQAEYNRKHINASINLPLSGFAASAPAILDQIEQGKIVFMCRSGMRAMKALQHAKQINTHQNLSFSVYRGGLIEWVKQGKPVQKNPSSSFTPARKMQFAVLTLFVVLTVLVTFIQQ